MSKTLLQIAKAHQEKNPWRIIGPQEIELAISWLKGEITLTQANIALGGSRASHRAYILLRALKSAYDIEIIKITGRYK